MVSATNALEVGVENPGRERVAAETVMLLFNPPCTVKKKTVIYFRSTAES
jgi:hypothetical protein